MRLSTHDLPRAFLKLSSPEFSQWLMGPFNPPPTESVFQTSISASKGLSGTFNPPPTESVFETIQLVVERYLRWLAFNPPPTESIFEIGHQNASAYRCVPFNPPPTESVFETSTLPPLLTEQINAFNPPPTKSVFETQQIGKPYIYTENF